MLKKLENTNDLIKNEPARKRNLGSLGGLIPKLKAFLGISESYTPYNYVHTTQQRFNEVMQRFEEASGNTADTQESEAEGEEGEQTTEN